MANGLDPLMMVEVTGQLMLGLSWQGACKFHGGGQHAGMMALMTLQKQTDLLAVRSYGLCLTNQQFRRALSMSWR